MFPFIIDELYEWSLLTWCFTSLLTEDSLIVYSLSLFELCLLWSRGVVLLLFLSWFYDYPFICLVTLICCYLYLRSFFIAFFISLSWIIKKYYFARILFSSSNYIFFKHSYSSGNIFNLSVSNYIVCSASGKSFSKSFSN